MGTRLFTCALEVDLLIKILDRHFNDQSADRRRRIETAFIKGLFMFLFYEQPVVSPQSAQSRHDPFRFILMLPHAAH